MNLETKESHNSPISVFRVPGCLRSGWCQSAPETHGPNASCQGGDHPVASHPSIKMSCQEQPWHQKMASAGWKKREDPPHTSYNNNTWYLLMAYPGPGIVLLCPPDPQWTREQVLPWVTDEGTDAQRGEAPCWDHTAVSGGAGWEWIWLQSQSLITHLDASITTPQKPGEKFSGTCRDQNCREWMCW